MCTSGNCGHSSAIFASRFFLRDKGICVECGVDTMAAQRKLRYSRGSKRLALLEHWGLRARTRKSLWDADHVLPVAEGGECDLDNLRTLCLRCHREATKRLRERLQQILSSPSVD